MRAVVGVAQPWRGQTDSESWRCYPVRLRFWSAEEVLFSDLFQKINRRDKAQDRAILVTNRAVYNLKPTNFASCKRRIPVELVDAVTVSQVRCRISMLSWIVSPAVQWLLGAHAAVRRFSEVFEVGSCCDGAAWQVSDEFVLHVPEEYDYRLLGPRKTECIEAIQRAHVTQCRSRFVVHESTQILLKSVCSTKPMMKEKRKVLHCTRECAAFAALQRLPPHGLRG